jgi:hypothetical protein
MHDDGPDALEMAVRLTGQVAIPGQNQYESGGKVAFGGIDGAW